MKIYLQDLKNLLTTIQKHKVQELKVLDKNFELIVSNFSSLLINYDATISSIHSYIDNTKNQVVKEKENIFTNNNIKKSDDYITITSPMVGTFYRASSPEEPPFINISDIIYVNQTVCIIEAMKLMNEVEAEASGKVIDILVENGECVDCGQELIIIEPLETK